MPTHTATRIIDAPPELVFEVIAHIQNFSKAVPHIEKVEFLTEQHEGVGTRFAETRTMNGRKATVTLEVTEYEPPSRVRIVSDEAGTVWDSVFTVEAEGDKAKLTLAMEERAYKLMAKVMNPLIRGTVRKGLEADLDAVKAYCEEEAAEEEPTEVDLAAREAQAGLGGAEVAAGVAGGVAAASASAASGAEE